MYQNVFTCLCIHDHMEHLYIYIIILKLNFNLITHHVNLGNSLKATNV